MKEVIWLGSSLRRLRSFPSVTQDIAGYQLFNVQCGLDPDDWRPMPEIATGVIEIRVHEPHEHRVLYVAKYPEMIYVLHCFEKKSQQTPKKEIEIARKEYASLQERRKKSSKPVKQAEKKRGLHK